MLRRKVYFTYSLTIEGYCQVNVT